MSVRFRSVVVVAVIAVVGTMLVPAVVAQEREPAAVVGERARPETVLPPGANSVRELARTEDVEPDLEPDVTAADEAEMARPGLLPRLESLPLDRGELGARGRGPVRLNPEGLSAAARAGRAQVEVLEAELAEQVMGGRGLSDRERIESLRQHD